jgi:hypothetical protein
MHQTKDIPPNTEDKAKIESLRLCVERERHAEKTFVRYAMVAIVTTCLIAIGKSQAVITVPLIGNINKEVLLENVFYVKLFLMAIIVFGFLGWFMAVTDLSRHELYPSISAKKSWVTVVVNKLDSLFSSQLLKSMSLVDVFQDIILFFILIMIIVFLLKVA